MTRLRRATRKSRGRPGFGAPVGGTRPWSGSSRSSVGGMGGIVPAAASRRIPQTGEVRARGGSPVAWASGSITFRGALRSGAGESANRRSLIMAIGETRAEHEVLGLGEEDLRRIYRFMLLARRTDERSWILNRQGKAAFVISCQGQEAAQVGAAYCLRPGYDYVYPYYRDHAIVTTLGVTARDEFLALLARKEDPNSGGRQMPGHFSNRDPNNVTASAPKGVRYPPAGGPGLPSQRAKAA